MNKYISFSLLGLIIFVIQVITFFYVEELNYYFLMASIISLMLAYRGLLKENGINIKFATFTLFFQVSILAFIAFFLARFSW